MLGMRQEELELQDAVNEEAEALGQGAMNEDAEALWQTAINEEAMRQGEEI